MLDQTTTVQNKKEMGVLILYQNESEGLIVTQYLMSLFLGVQLGSNNRTRANPLPLTQLVISRP